VKSPDDKASGSSQTETPEPADLLNQDLVEEMRGMAASGLNPSSSLALLGKLIAEIPAVSRENLDRIKTMDKLINSARYMMEAKLKNDEAVNIMRRLDEMEEQMEELAEKQASGNPLSAEVWKKHQKNE
jgi:hypothetical protein